MRQLGTLWVLSYFCIPKRLPEGPGDWRRVLGGKHHYEPCIDFGIVFGNEQHTLVNLKRITCRVVGP